MSRPHVVIVGGGIAGLAAAYLLRDEPAEVTVLEGSPQLGGKLTASEVAGVSVDAGAEALLRRRPEGTDLISAVGLGERLVLPGTTASAIWSRGALHPLPPRQFMGVPADLDGLAASGVLSAAGLTRARQDLELPATPRDGDVPVAAYIGARFGPELVDRLVDPLLGGVYAGRSEQLSFEATLGPLASAAGSHRSLAEAVGSLIPAPPAARAGTDAPARPAVFTTLTDGLGALPAAVAAASGATVRTRATVRELTRTATGWRLVVGSAADPEEILADAVVLALPARPASRLLSGVPGASAAAAALAAIEYASMAIVTLAYPRSRFPVTRERSGYLVPAVEGRAVKAVTFSTIKWPHLAARPNGGEPIDIIRCSIGRIGEEGVLQRDDADLVALAAAELADQTGAQGPPVDTRVTRWGGGLPQYTVGHLDRVATIHDAVGAQPGLAVCGAAYAGIGIPACIATADSAAQRVRDFIKSTMRSIPG
ncbi:MAG TPA: protoporphyrinogen oxidase [Streptosporangiaceae bacterium]